MNPNRIAKQEPYLSMINVANRSCPSHLTAPRAGASNIPMLTCGFVRSKTAAYDRVKFNAARFCLRACCKGLTVLPCCSTDRADRKKGVTDRAKTAIFCKGDRHVNNTRLESKVLMSTLTELQNIFSAFGIWFYRLTPDIYCGHLTPFYLPHSHLLSSDHHL